MVSKALTGGEGRAGLSDLTDLAAMGAPIRYLLIPPTILALALWWVAGIGYLLAHTLAELFSILVAFTAVVVARTSRQFTRNQFVIFIAIAIGWCAGLDLLHMLVFKGMNLIAVDGANTATQFWIAARSIQAAALLASPFMLTRTVRPLWTSLVFGVLALSAAVVIFGGYFPDAFIEGAGLTPFKIRSEYVIISVLGVALALIWQRRELLSGHLFLYIAAALCAMMLSEFSFTRYASVNAQANLIGHILKVYSYWFIYVALVESTLQEPFGALTQAASTYDAIPDPTYIVSGDGTIHQANAAAGESQRRSSASLAGKNVHDVLHDRDVPVDECPVCRWLGKSGGEFLANLSLPHDRHAEWHVAPFSAEQHDPPMWVMVVRDVTERERLSRERQDLLRNLEERVSELNALNEIAREAEASARWSQKSLAESEQRLRTIIETSSDVICTLDREGRFLEISRNCEQILGWPREAMLGRPCFEFMVEADRASQQRAFSERLSGRPQSNSANRYVRSDGTIVEMLWSATWIDRDQVCHCIGRNMTEQNALRARVNLSQRMDALGQLTGGIAHDFNNLLTIVLGSSEALVEQLEDGEQQQLAELIMQAAEQGSALTRRLLAFSRSQPLEPGRIDINAHLETMGPLIRRTLGGDLHFKIDKFPGLRPAFADAGQMEAAVLNLCLNARDAMPNGGTLSISTENVHLSEEAAAARPDARAGDYAAIHVSDTGTGIAPEVVDRIFEPFFTTKEKGKGTGLGLSMVYGFIVQSKGYIDCKTALGKGTRFSLYIPAARDLGDEPTGPDRSETSYTGGSEMVLVVEDNDLVAQHVCGQFQSLGYRVVRAATGKDALAILEQRDDIDLLFTDIVMPGGMNGWQLAEIVARRWPAMRVLFTSGYADDALVGGKDMIDGLTLLSKPYTKRELSETVRSVLDQDRAV